MWILTWNFQTFLSFFSWKLPLMRMTVKYTQPNDSYFIHKKFLKVINIYAQFHKCLKFINFMYTHNMSIIKRKNVRWTSHLQDFSVAKATLQLPMSVCLSVILLVWQQNLSTAWNHHPSSFILLPSSFFIHPSFISRLLSFSTCWFTPTSFNLEI